MYLDLTREANAFCNSVSFNSMHSQEKSEFKGIIYMKKYAMLNLLRPVHTQLRDDAF